MQWGLKIMNTPKIFTYTHPPTEISNLIISLIIENIHSSKCKKKYTH